MNIYKKIGIIPCRMASSRLPGKPMMMILKKPMLEHVWRRSQMSTTLDDLYIATCDEAIHRYMTKAGAKVILTRPSHERSQERVVEAVEHIIKNEGVIPEIVVNIGGDEPFIYPEMIDQAVLPLIADPSIMVTNLIAPICSEEEFNDQNVVKVVKNIKNEILFFTRLAVPLDFKKTKKVSRFKQLSVIGFRKEFLFTYQKLSPTPCEILESIDMMRILEHGYPIHAVETGIQTINVDTPSDYYLAEKLMQNDALYKRMSHHE